MKTAVVHVSPETSMTFVKVLVYFILISLSLAMVFPFLWMVLGSFKSLRELSNWPFHLLPGKWRFENFVVAAKTAGLWRAMLNSFIYAGSTTFLVLIVSSLAAFGFAKYNFFGKNILFLLVIATVVFPIEVTMIPLYMILRRLGWLGTYHGLILPRIAQGFGIFLLRQNFMTIPDSYLDAARIDGSSEVLLLWKVVVPLSRSVLIILGLFTFLWRWNEVLWPLVVMLRPEKYTLQVKLTTFIGDPAYVNWHHLLAGVTMACVPTIILFFVLQRYVLKGIVLSGLKG